MVLRSPRVTERPSQSFSDDTIIVVVVVTVTCAPLQSMRRQTTRSANLVTLTHPPSIAMLMPRATVSAQTWSRAMFTARYFREVVPAVGDLQRYNLWPANVRRRGLFKYIHTHMHTQRHRYAEVSRRRHDQTFGRQGTRGTSAGRR